MNDRFWRRWRTFGRHSTAGAPIFAENSLTDAHSAPDREAVAGLDALHWMGLPSDWIRREEVPRAWILVFAALLFVYLFTSGAPKLFDQIDGQYAGAAREMMVGGDWLIPTQNGVPRLQKPPLVYWCEMLSMSVFGINEFGARFPVALATVGWFLATGLLARRVVGTWSAGIAGALTLAMATGSFFFSHLVMPEPFLGCFIAMTFWSLLKARQAEGFQDQKGEVDRWLITAWFFIALSTLAKGIHGLFIPVVAVTCAAWLRPSIRPLGSRFLLRPHGWILLLLVLAPWYLATESRYPGFLVDHFFNEQIGSALSRRSPPDSDHVSLWIFWPEQLVLLFPVSLLFPAAITAALQRWKDRRARLSDGGVLLLCWFLVVALGISFANVQDYYLMIAWAPVAIGTAWAVTRNKISYQWPASILVLLGAAGLLAGLLLAVSHGSAPDDAASRKLLIGDTILNVFQILPPAAWKEIVPLLCLASSSVLVAGVLVLLFDRQGRAELCLAVFGLMMAAIFAIGTRSMQLTEEEFSSAKVAEAIDARDGPESIVIAQGDPNEKTTLFFYLHRPIFWVDGHPNIEFATRSLGIGRDHYLTRQQVAKAWGETKQVFLVTEESGLAQWKDYLGPDRLTLIGSCGSRVILVNRR